MLSFHLNYIILILKLIINILLKKNNEILPRKILKTGEGKPSDVGIKNFNVFVNEIKENIGDTKENVEI